MKKNLRHISTKVCSICGKGDTMSWHRPHSLHRTKRVVKPNLQMVAGRLLCARCRRTLRSKAKPSAI